MGTPIDLGRMFGVNVRIDLSVLLLAALFIFTGLPKNPELQHVLDQTTFVVFLILSIFLHEMGHAAGARLFGIRTLDVTLTFFGGYARLEQSPRTTIADVVISFSGPAANLAISGLLYLFLFSETGIALDDRAWLILRQVQLANLVLGIFNLLPGYPLDGGNIARAILGSFLRMTTARLIVGYIGVVVGFIVIALDLNGTLGYGLMVGLLLIWYASMEIQAARSSRF